MREIEFRVWDKALSRYRSGLTLSCDIGQICSSNPEHYIIEQFTGLRDKNGKKIFEGDILNFDDREFGGENKFFIITFGKNHYDSGCYHFIGFGLKPIGRHDLDEHGLMFESADFCVIGNIHENPELLEVKSE